MMDEEKKKMITDVPTRPDYDDELIKKRRDANESEYH